MNQNAIVWQFLLKKFRNTKEVFQLCLSVIVTMQHKLDLRMAKWAVVEGTDLLLVGSMFAGATQPELIVHKRASTHNARWKLRVTVRTNLAPIGYHGFAASALCLVTT